MFDLGASNFISSFFAIILINKNKLNFLQKHLQNIFNFAIDIVILIIFALPLSSEGHNAMCKYLEIILMKGVTDQQFTYYKTIYFDTF